MNLDSELTHYAAIDINHQLSNQLNPANTPKWHGLFNYGEELL
jgi:hypothetical protein